MFALFYLISLTSFGFSQITTIINQETIGGGLSDFANSSIIESDGSILIVGASSSGISGDKGIASYGGTDIWLMKLNPDLTINWEMVYGGSSSENSPKIISTPDGGYLLCCTSYSPISGNKTVANYGGSDYWILKLDSNGNVQWQNVYGGGGNETFYDVQLTSSVEYVVIGGSSSDISGNKTENSYGFEDYWIVKIDNSGSIIWDLTLGGDDYDRAFTVIIDDNDDIVVGGFSLSNISGTKSEPSYGGQDLWITKINQSGLAIWDKTFGGDDDEDFCQLIVADNSYYIASSSYSNSSGLKSENSFGLNDLWLMKLSMDGSIIWDKTIGGGGVDGPAHAIFTGDNQILVNCISNSDISGYKSENAINNSPDFWIVSIDTNGNFMWDKTIGGNSIDVPSFILEKADNNYIIGGYSDSNISADKDENSMGSEDYWILEIASNVGVVNYNNHPDVQIYPNPVSDELFFSQQISGAVIFDLSGKIVYSNN